MGDGPDAVFRQVTTPTVIRRTAGGLLTGGGGIGIAVALTELQRQFAPSAATAIVCLFFIAYTLGLGIGVGLIEARARALKAARIYFAVQIPLVTSHAISYQFACGAYVYIIVNGRGFSVPMSVGSLSTLIVAGDAPFSVGLNLVAVLFTILLWRRA